MDIKFLTHAVFFLSLSGGYLNPIPGSTKLRENFFAYQVRGNFFPGIEAGIGVPVNKSLILSSGIAYRKSTFSNDDSGLLLDAIQHRISVPLCFSYHVSPRFVAGAGIDIPVFLSARGSVRPEQGNIPEVAAKFERWGDANVYVEASYDTQRILKPFARAHTRILMPGHKNKGIEEPVRTAGVQAGIRFHFNRNKSATSK